MTDKNTFSVAEELGCELIEPISQADLAAQSDSDMLVDLLEQAARKGEPIDGVPETKCIPVDRLVPRVPPDHRPLSVDTDDRGSDLSMGR